MHSDNHLCIFIRRVSSELHIFIPINQMWHNHRMDYYSVAKKERTIDRCNDEAESQTHIICGIKATYYTIDLNDILEKAKTIINRDSSNNCNNWGWGNQLTTKVQSKGNFLCHGSTVRIVLIYLFILGDSYMGLLEMGKATHSSILAWRIPWTQSMGSQRVRHDWMIFAFTFTWVFTSVKFCTAL